MRGDTVDNTRNGISNILCRRDDQRTCQQQNGGENVVQSKDSIVGLYLLKLEIIL